MCRCIVTLISISWHSNIRSMFDKSYSFHFLVHHVKQHVQITSISFRRIYIFLILNIKWKAFSICRNCKVAVDFKLLIFWHFEILSMKSQGKCDLEQEHYWRDKHLDLKKKTSGIHSIIRLEPSDNSRDLSEYESISHTSFGNLIEICANWKLMR